MVHAFRHGVLIGLSQVPRVPGRKQNPGRDLLECLRDRRDDVLQFTTVLRISPTSNQADYAEFGVMPSWRWKPCRAGMIGLASAAPGEPPTVLAALGQELPQLTSEIQADVAEKLEHRPRPVGFIDTSKRSTETIKIGDITVSGPIPAMRQYARMEELRDQTWQVIVRGNERPKRSYK